MNSEYQLSDEWKQRIVYLTNKLMTPAIKIWREAMHSNIEYSDEDVKKYMKDAIKVSTPYHEMGQAEYDKLNKLLNYNK